MGTRASFFDPIHSCLVVSSGNTVEENRFPSRNRHSKFPTFPARTLSLVKIIILRDSLVLRQLFDSYLSSAFAQENNDFYGKREGISHTIFDLRMLSWWKYSWFGRDDFRYVKVDLRVQWEKTCNFNEKFLNF